MPGRPGLPNVMTSAWRLAPACGLRSNITPCGKTRWAEAFLGRSGHLGAKWGPSFESPRGGGHCPLVGQIIIENDFSQLENYFFSA